MSQPRSDLQFVTIPAEHATAVEAMWLRTRQLVYSISPAMADAFKPLILSIYWQGLLDGYDIKSRERSKQ